jgi:2-iminobutanoate/2-iminopropanoate deaminase
MPRQIISTPDAPEFSGYSQAVKVGTTIYVAGTIGVDAATGELAGRTIQEQARQSLLNCRAILRARRPAERRRHGAHAAAAP